MSSTRSAVISNPGRVRTERSNNEPTPSAVIYLRVSTKEQAEIGGEVEGYSIPAQRVACVRKAQTLGATVSAEFIDAGESARSIHRPELQKMLDFIRSHPVTYVIVHKVDRLARNRVDDVEINLALQTAGARLVSVTENIDESPSGILLHGIMSSIAEFYSRNLANEVIKGATQKAKTGGTVNKAPTGYLNIRKIIDGREVRTIDVDPTRGPRMTWAFEQYATGDWAIRPLLDALTAKGLDSVGGPGTRVALSPSRTYARQLRNPYYKCVVVYQGVRYPGAHPPLVTPELWDAVQHVLDVQAQSGVKQRVYDHYLKGSIFCGTCGSRLSVLMAKDRWGKIYPYCYCLGRQERRTACTQRMPTIDQLEARIGEHYATIQLTAQQRADVRTFILEQLDTATLTAKADMTRAGQQVVRLEKQRAKLLEAYYAGAVPLAQL